MIKQITAFTVGTTFAIGLGISGLTDANKVIAFLDIFGQWDPSLIFVMMGAIASHMLFYRFSTKREAPLFDKQFHVPTRRDVDTKLLTGATLFGVGWGLSGFCPGPAISGLVSGRTEVFVFVAAMLIGILVARKLGPLLDRLASRRSANNLSTAPEGQ